MYFCPLFRWDLGPVSRKSRKLFGPEKPLVKLRFAYSVKLVFSYVVKQIKIKISSWFRASRGLCFKDTKTIMSPEMRPKSFGTFEKRAAGQCSFFLLRLLSSTCSYCKEDGVKERCTSLALPVLGA